MKISFSYLFEKHLNVKEILVQVKTGLNFIFFLVFLYLMWLFYFKIIFYMLKLFNYYHVNDPMLLCFLENFVTDFLVLSREPVHENYVSGIQFGVTGSPRT